MTAFPEFAFNRPIRPCVLTRDLLQQLEKQLLAAESDMFSGEAKVASRRYEVSVFDSYGVETFSSVGDIPTSGFPEGTESVRVVLECSSAQAERSLKLKIVFRESHGNQLTFRARGPQARERMIGLWERMRQLVDSRPLDNWIFRRREWVSAILGLVVFLVGLIWAGETYSLISKQGKVDLSSYFIHTIVVWTAVAYLAITHWFFPRCAFETSGWARIEQWKTWAAQGFLGLVVFDGAALAFAERIAAALGL